MNFNEYQQFCQEVRLPTASTEYAILSLGGEAGELLGYIGKAIRDGRKPDYDQNIKKELGDVLWNVAIIALDHGFTLQDVADANVNKLSSRRERGTLQGSGDSR